MQEGVLQQRSALSYCCPASWRQGKVGAIAGKQPTQLADIYDSSFPSAHLSSLAPTAKKKIRIVLAIFMKNFRVFFSFS